MSIVRKAIDFRQSNFRILTPLFVYLGPGTYFIIIVVPGLGNNERKSVFENNMFYVATLFGTFKKPIGTISL